MATYSTIQSRVLTRLIDTPSAVRAEVPTLVNTALRDIMKGRDWKCMETSVDVVTDVTNTNHILMAKPSDWKVANGKAYFFADPTGRSRNIEWKTDLRYALDTYGTRDSYPQTLVEVIDNTKMDGSSNFLLFPFVDGASNFDDGEYRISIPYYRSFPLFAQPTDTNWFSVYADNYLIYYATALGFMVDWDEGNAAIWFQAAQTEFKKLSTADKLAEVQNVQTLEIRTGGARRD